MAHATMRITVVVHPILTMDTFGPPTAACAPPLAGFVSFPSDPAREELNSVVLAQGWRLRVGIVTAFSVVGWGALGENSAPGIWIGDGGVLGRRVLLGGFTLKVLSLVSSGIQLWRRPGHSRRRISTPLEAWNLVSSMGCCLKL